jgi:hypothetical protein
MYGKHAGDNVQSLGRFREKNWISMNGSTWTIINADAIRRLAGV